MQRETHLQQAIRLALGREPDLVLWRNSGGVATHEQSGTTQRFGLCRGAADLVGVGPRGKFFALEVKTTRGRLSTEQSMFLDLVRGRGGFAAVVRSVEDARAALDRARRGECE
jgi:hypothetical protein